MREQTRGGKSHSHGTRALICTARLGRSQRRGAFLWGRPGLETSHKRTILAKGWRRRKRTRCSHAPRRLSCSSSTRSARSASAASLCTSLGPLHSRSTSGATPAALMTACWQSWFMRARAKSAPAALARPSAVPSSSSRTSSAMPPALAMAASLPTLNARLRSAPAACVRPCVLPSSRRRTRGATPPTRAIAALLSP
eukprot:scaffold235896_cov31-Tisochrysis_lutea.AAC.2